MVPASKLVNKSTTRIVCNNGAIGTGFFFIFQDSTNKEIQYPILITNKHVIAGASSASIIINASHASDKNFKTVTVNIDELSNRFLMHPSHNVDLCALPLGGLIQELQDSEINLNAFFFSDSNIYNDSSLMPIEEVFMTGYPNGLWDEVNNKPITRKGITASDVNENWNGAEQFMIDMACFGGSSGSPVYINNETGFMTSSGIAMGTRFMLLGILFAGPVLNVNGNVQIVEVPTASVAIATTGIMMNLGIVIKAKEIFAFKELLGVK